MIFYRFFSLLLILQMFLGPIAPVMAGSDSKEPESQVGDRFVEEGRQVVESDEDARKKQRALEQTISDLENLKDVETAGPRSTVDAFRIGNQTFGIADRGGEFTDYNLSTYNFELPSVSISDFDSEIEVVVNRSDLSLDFLKKKGAIVLARHRIHGLDVVAVARDVDLLQFVTSDGALHAIDMVFVRKAIFNMPIPVYALGAVTTSAKEAIAHGHAHKATFLTRGLKPFERDEIASDAVLSLDRETIWTAGDFVLFSVDSSGRRQLHGVYDRGTTLTQIQTGEAILAILANEVNPEDGVNLPTIGELFNDKDLASRLAGYTLGSAERGVLEAYDAKGIARLALRSQTNKKASKLTKKDRFLLKEWQESYASLIAKAKEDAVGVPSEDAGDLGGRWMALTKKTAEERSLFQRLLTPKALKRIAVLTTIGAASGAIVLGGQGYGPAWLVHFANELYVNYVPNVVKDGAYRTTLLKGSVALAAFLPVIYVIYSALGKKMRNWPFLRSFATTGMRVYSQIQLFFLSRVASLIRQPNFMKSLRAGINPFRKVKANSEEGRAAGLDEDMRPGINSPVSVGPKRKADLQKRSKALDALSSRRSRARALSWALATIVASEQAGLDSATILALQQGKLENLSKAELLEKLQSPEFQAERGRLARELFFVLKSLPKSASALSDLDPSELAAFYQRAKDVAGRMADRGVFGKVLAGLKLRTQEIFADKGLRALGNFGHAEQQFLKTADPNKFVQVQTWEQMKVDYLLAVVQVALFGARADLSDPKSLAAKNNPWTLWTTRPHLADMGMQVAIYGISVPSRMAQAYQMDTQPSEGNYAPIESITMAGNEREQGFLSTFWGWVKSVKNLREMNMGYYLWRAFSKRNKTIQAALIMDLTARVALAGQGLEAALPAFVYTTIWSAWGFGWQWEPVNRGLQVTEAEFDAKLEAYRDANRKISQGQRLDQPELTREGYVELNRLYAETSSSLPADLEKALSVAEGLLGVASEESLLKIKDLGRLTGAVSNLANAVENGEIKDVEAAYSQVKALEGGESIHIDEANPRAFLDYALEKPPVYTKADGWARYMPILMAALSTTYFATNMWVPTYHNQNWSSLIASSAVWSVGLYAATSYVQKAINYVGTSMDKVRAAEIQAGKKEVGLDPETGSKVGASKAEICKWVLSPEARLRKKIPFGQKAKQLVNQTHTDLKDLAGRWFLWWNGI